MLNTVMQSQVAENRGLKKINSQKSNIWLKQLLKTIEIFANVKNFFMWIYP